MLQVDLDLLFELSAFNALVRKNGLSISILREREREREMRLFS